MYTNWSIVMPEDPASGKSRTRDDMPIMVPVAGWSYIGRSGWSSNKGQCLDNASGLVVNGGVLHM